MKTANPQRFLRSLCAATNRVKERDAARSQLIEQMHRVREVSSRGLKNRDLEREFHELEVSIREALDKEVILSRKQVADELFAQELKERIARIEKQRADFEHTQLRTIHEGNRKIAELTHAVKDLHAIISQKAGLDIGEMKNERELYEHLLHSVQENSTKIGALERDIHKREQGFEEQVKEELFASHNKSRELEGEIRKSQEQNQQKVKALEEALQKLKERYDGLEHETIDDKVLSDLRKKLNSMKKKLRAIKKNL